VTNHDAPQETPATEDRIAELEARIHAMQRTELTRWADSVAESQRVFDELERMKTTVSWRVTAPLRAVRRKQLEG
jgi:uncharacterized coiled-coil protein SlyX